MTIKQLKIDYIEGEKLKIHIKADKKTVEKVRKIVEQPSYAHSKYWEDAKFGEEHKRVRRKNPEEHQKNCKECQNE